MLTNYELWHLWIYSRKPHASKVQIDIVKQRPSGNLWNFNSIFLTMFSTSSEKIGVIVSFWMVKRHLWIYSRKPHASKVQIDIVKQRPSGNQWNFKSIFLTMFSTSSEKIGVIVSLWMVKWHLWIYSRKPPASKVQIDIVKHRPSGN